MEPYIYVAFEGPIAAGKTTLCTLLAEHLTAEKVLEDFEGNKFLTDFYRDRQRWALPMQLWFLAARDRELNSVTKPLVRHVIADYSYLKNGVFANVLLKDRELRLYANLDGALAANSVKPDLIVYLDARDEVLLDRIRRRARPYEADIKATYLRELRIAYEARLQAGTGQALLRSETSDLDLSSDAQINEFYASVLRAAQSVTRHE